MQTGRKVTEIISAVTVFVLFAVILSLVVFTAASYRNAGRSLDKNSNKRAVLSYIVNCVRDSAEDGGSAAMIEERSGYECLVISGDDGFEQRFYENDGKLMEEYTRADAEIRPQDALVIGDVERFDLAIDEKGILTIRTDAGSSSACTRRADS